MKNHAKLIYIIFLAYMVGSFLLPKHNSFAAFNLAVDPFAGGFDLRFGRLDSDAKKEVKEITLTVTTDIAKQYRVYQRIERPLRAANGIEIDSNQFKMYTLINSNTRGTLERLEEFPVMFSDTVLYTSNTAGDGDTFKVVYTLEPSTNQSPGSYYGRIIYILRPIASAQEQVVKILNMYADLTNQGSVEISTNTGSKRIRISSRDLDRASVQHPTVKISVKGNMGLRYRIYQQLRSPRIKSASGENFDLSKVTYEIDVAKRTSAIKQKLGSLSDLRSKSLVYSSDDLGSSDEMVITYKPTKDFAQQNASFYTGSINYYIELDRSTRGIDDPGFIDAVDLEIEIERIFRIVAISLSEDDEPLNVAKIQKKGGVLLRFGKVDYKSGPKMSKVRLKVESNLNRPYLVTQKLASPLESAEGHKIPDELFTFIMKNTDATQGKIKFKEEAIFKSEKDMSIFVSNARGKSDDFDITYKLEVTPNTRGGDYTTTVSYSLSEL